MRILLGLAVAGWIAVAALVWWLWPVAAQLFDDRRIERTFYIPAQSMLPTLEVNDRVRPLAPEPASLRRGVVIVFSGPDGARVARIVGIGGDTVILRGGHISIDGRPVVLRAAGAGPTIEGEPSRRWSEQLPGEQRPHAILDFGASTGDDHGPVQVPSGKLFVLGDNRDRAADSRFGPEEQGVGLVSAGDVIGVVDRLLWSRGFRSFGTHLDEQR